MGAHPRLDRRRVDPGEGGLRKSARRSESVLTLLTYPQFSLGKYPRGESNSHLRFRKPPFYPLNYGDKMRFFLLVSPLCVTLAAEWLKKGRFITGNGSRKSVRIFISIQPAGT